MLDGPTTDKVTGVALQHALHKVDIFSNSWGPSDDGKTCDQLGRLTREAFINGITKVSGNFCNLLFHARMRLNFSFFFDKISLLKPPVYTDAITMQN